MSVTARSSSAVERADQRTGDDDIDGTARKRLRRMVRLRQPERVERDIGVTLEAAFGIPVGLSVADEGEHHALQPRRTQLGGCRVRMPRADAACGRRVRMPPADAA